MRHGLDSRSYPLDPNGDWFNETMVQAAERIYAPRKPLYSDESSRPTDVEKDPELRRHFQRQDAERLPLKRQVQVHGERLPNGDPTPEMLAFMRCCARQAEANAAIYAKRNRKAFAPEASMTQAEINAAMGVAATERPAWERCVKGSCHRHKECMYTPCLAVPRNLPKHEDPEELRRGRVELGLEE